MQNRHTLKKVGFFLLPAILAIGAYTSYYDNLFKVACKDCDKIFQQSNQDGNGINFKKLFALLDELRQSLGSKYSVPNYRSITPMDLAILDNKLLTFNDQLNGASVLNRLSNNQLTQNPPAKAIELIADTNRQSKREKFNQAPADIPSNSGIAIMPPTSNNGNPQYLYVTENGNGSGGNGSGGNGSGGNGSGGNGSGGNGSGGNGSGGNGSGGNGSGGNGSGGNGSGGNGSGGNGSGGNGSGGNGSGGNDPCVNGMSLLSGCYVDNPDNGSGNPGSGGNGGNGTSTVPLPASVYFFMFGLFSFILFRKIKKMS